MGASLATIAAGLFGPACASTSTVAFEAGPSTAAQNFVSQRPSACAEACWSHIFRLHLGHETSRVAGCFVPASVARSDTAFL